MQFAESHAELREAIPQFLRGELSASDLKHASAPLGIYQQRNDLFMTRIRITGGHLSVPQLRGVAAIIRAHGIGYGHLTTRQDIQLQDVPAEHVLDVVGDCSMHGLPFRGGGGNTFRNITMTATSGIGTGSLFDVLPYAKSLTELIFTWDKAFVLPRKIKIGFFDSPADELRAAVQDLGFIATVVDGARGFKVYGGGGMGRESTTGLLLFDFLPADQVPRCALAMTELFSDHGNRENRNQARIRFIVKRLGEDGFRALFQEYFDRLQPEISEFPACPFNVDVAAAALPSVADAECDDPGFLDWVARVTTPTRFGDDVVTVRVFVPGGNLSADEIESLAEIAETCGDSFLRLTPTQDVLLPLVPRGSLPAVYQALRKAFPKTDVLLESLVGHLVTCVGSTVCKIGILDSPAAGQAVARRLDQMLAEHPELDATTAARIVDDIRISGCPNTCGAHVAASIGMQGQKAKIEGKTESVYYLFVKSDDGFSLGTAQPEPVKEADLPDRVCQLVLGRLEG
jgi:sulfite reductase beta subunit-like hemoprotein